MDDPTDSTEAKKEPLDEGELLTELPTEASLRPASPQERFAAFLIDGLFFFYLLGAWGVLLKHLTRGDMTTPFAYKESGSLLFVSTAAALYFLYYVTFEGVLTATPGKLLGGLAIQKRSGGTPSLFAIFVRNILRIVDYPFFFFAGVGLIEMTQKHQRLGDLLSGTIVVREISFEERRINPDVTHLASITRRTIAFLLDLALLVPFFYGILLMVPVSRPLIAMVALNLVPTVTLFYITLSEAVFQTTFGKALLGMKVTQEDGRPARFSTLALRNIFRIFDTNPIGYLCGFLSGRKQRPGDIAAGTVVFKDTRGLRGWIAIPYMLILAAAAAYLGLANPDSFLKKNVAVQIGPYEVHPAPPVIRRIIIRGLQIEKIEFGLTENRISKERNFSAGEVIYLVFRISGYAIKAEKAWVQVDLKVRDSHRNIILDRTNIINSSVTVGTKKSAKLAARFALHPQASPGRYEAILTLRDMFANQKTEEKATFNVRP